MSKLYPFSFDKKNILLISPEPWNYVFVSKHHYAIELAKKGNQVYFINAPSSKQKGITIREEQDYPGLFIVDYRILFKGQRFLPGFLRRTIDRFFFRQLQKKAKCKFDVVINFENSRFYDFRFLPPDILSIYFQVDENQDYHPLVAARSANITLAINEEIRLFLQQSGKEVFKISHGFSGTLSGQAKDIIEGQYNYQPTNKNLTAAYVGNIDNGYVNQDLLIELVQAYPEITFILYGPYSAKGKVYQSLMGMANVIFKGKIPSYMIAGELAKADILFYLYIDSFDSSSHKVLEYLASGKAIIGNQLKEYQEADFISFADSKIYLAKFKELISTIKERNNTDLMRKRIEFAVNNNYGKKLLQVEEIINDNAIHKK
jgi:glycosyltransferase involved in cell wall biosynthesis